MARKRDPARDEAERLWLESGKEMPLKEIAERIGKQPGQVRKWKSLDNWGTEKKHDVTNEPEFKRNVTIEKERSFLPATEELIKNEDLTEKRKMFCLYYLQRFNATWAYMKAYGGKYDVANVEGPRLLVNPSIQKQLTKLKKSVMGELHLTVVDIASEYAKQAHSDVGDYLSFSSEKVLRWHKIHRKKGKYLDDHGRFDYLPTIDPNTDEQAFYIANSVDFKSPEFVDTSLIKSVKINNGDVDLELYDKQVALDALLKLVDQAEVDKEFKHQRLEKTKADAQVARAKADSISGVNEVKQKATVDRFLDGLEGVLADDEQEADNVEPDTDA